MIRLKKLKLRNWATFKDTELDFPDHGLVLLVGHTQGTLGQTLESVGAGKTALGEAIFRTLAGINGRNTELSHYCHDGTENNMLVTVTADCDGTPLIVDSGFKCPELSHTGEGLRFSFGGAEVRRNRVSLTRVELEKIVSITPELANWTLFVDGQRLNFNDLTQQQAVELVMTALKQPAWSKFHDHAKTVLTGFRQDLSKAEISNTCAVNSHLEATTRVSEAKKRLGDTEAAYERELQANAQRLSDVRQRIAENENEKSRLNLELKKHAEAIKEIENSDSSQFKTLTIDRRKFDNKLSRALRFKKSREQKLRNTEAEIGETTRLIQDVKKPSSNCPKCGQPLTVKHRGQEVHEQHERLQILKETKIRLASLREAAAGDAARFQQELAAIDTALDDLGTRRKVEDLSSKCASIENKLHRLSTETQMLKDNEQSLLNGPSRAALERQEAVVLERIEILRSTEIASQDAAIALSDAGDALKTVEYIARLFSPTGIPNMVIQEAVQPLNDISRRISSLMTGGAINVSYSTSKVLSSGDERAQLNIAIDNKLGAKRVRSSSKGETGLVNLIVAETLAEIGSVSTRVGCCFYDEVANSQDSVTRQNVFQYLKDKAARLKSLIFLVDHHPESAQYADHILAIDKSSERVSSAHWVR